MLTRDQACDLIDYLEILEGRVNHQDTMEQLRSETGLDEKRLDAAAKALSAIAERTYGIL